MAEQKLRLGNTAKKALALVLALGLSGAPGLALADEEAFANAMAAYELGDDAEALRLFDKALKGKGLAEADRLAIYTYGGVAAFRSGDKKRAGEYFQKALAIDKEVIAPYEAPQEAKDLLERMRAGGAPPSGGGVGIGRHMPGTAEFKVDRPQEVDAGQPIPLKVRKVSGDIVDVLVHFRTPGGSWTQATLLPKDDTVFEGEIPAPPADPETGGSVEFYLEAQDSQGDTVARFGSEGTPKVTKVRATGLAVVGTPKVLTAEPADGEPDEPADFGTTGETDDEGESVFEQWWFWTGAGVVVAGGAVLAIVLLTGEEEGGIPCDETAAGTGCMDVTVTGVRAAGPGVIRW